jgi:LuxR family maltose regulon positive regulatory protein
LDPSILTTKLYRPAPRPDYINRQELIDHLDGALTRNLTLVSAPAGFGKTTLLSIWAQQKEQPVSWLSLDTEDNDLVVFLQYLIAALQTISPDVGGTSISLLQSSQPPSIVVTLSALINDLSLIPQDFILILDDYHLIEQAKNHAAIIYLLDHLPPRMHLVIISRSDPPLPLSRLRVRDQLLEIRQADLRMTQKETNQFLNQSMRLDLSQEQVAALESRTEGWIAGLQLAALSLREKEDKDAFLGSFSGSHRFIIDYLADEVFSQLPPDLRSFLTKTAILDRFTPQLCDLVTGRSDSNAILLELEEANLFLIPLDDRREWYRYHHLFLDYLRTSSDLQDEAELHKKAARWFSDNQLYAQAVKHALSTGDTNESIRAISLAAPIAIQQAAFSNLFNWFDALPDQVIRDNCELAIYMSFALFLTQSYKEALPYVRAARKNLPADASSSLQGKLLSLQAHLALFKGKSDDVISLSRDALEYLDDDDTFFRNLTLNVLGQILEMKGDVVSAAGVYRQAFNTGSKTGDRLGSLVVFTNLVYSLNELGQLNEAVALCQKVNHDIGGELIGGRPLSDVISMPWSMLSYETDQLDSAHQGARRALDSLTQFGVSQGISLAQYTLALVHLANGELEEMRRHTRTGYQHAAYTGTANTIGTWFTALDAQASIQIGDIAAANQWADNIGYSPQDDPHHWVENSYFTYTRLLLAQDRIQDARTLLTTMGTNAQQGARLRKLITINLLFALTELAQEDRHTALQHLERALSFATPQNYRRAILNEGQAILNLLPDVRHIAPDFVDELLAVTPQVSTAPPRIDQPYESLSERELEVLRLVSRGLSNRQIAEALFVTLGTVKKHLNNIFGKLQVTNRTQAVARSRELNLLD